MMAAIIATFKDGEEELEFAGLFDADVIENCDCDDGADGDEMSVGNGDRAGDDGMRQERQRSQRCR